jgi:hypothetical protein
MLLLLFLDLEEYGDRPLTPIYNLLQSEEMEVIASKKQVFYHIVVP